MVATLRPAASAPTLSTSEVGVPVSAAALTRETMLARLKYDLVNNEVKALRTKQARARSRLDGFTSQEDLGAEKDEDAAKVAALEAEQREVERQSRECYFQRKTYEQIITRLKEEATTYTPEMEQLDVMQAAKEGDSKQLMLMVKDANAVRDVAREELRKVEEEVHGELRARKKDVRERRRKVQDMTKRAQEHEKRTVQAREELEDQRSDALRRTRELVAVSARALDDEREQIEQCAAQLWSAAARNSSARISARADTAPLRRYERQFAQMKEATGVHTATAVIEKFVAQEETPLGARDAVARGARQDPEQRSEREAARQRLVDARYATATASRAWPRARRRP